ncbi:phage baseplate protein, partial [Thomasclavelia ramosa]|uniref:phage baseplate protein n=1 Tax=Thomasclavelia ramosa TaxID=1547 RepID=UPI003AADC89A
MANNKFLEETGLSRLWSHVKKLVDTRATKIETRVTSLESQVNADKLTAYPVGAIYMSVSPTSPASLFGGTWTQWGSGRVPIGINSSDSDFNTVEKTNGTKINRIGFITAGNGYGLA